ncbi:hypothetical protein ES705_34789 [subsurface metagenome]
MNETIKTLDKPARAGKHWKPDELEYLADQYGLICDKTLAARLQRSESAIIKIASYKRVVARTGNFYTASALAKLLGIPCPRQVLGWVKKGWLKGRPSAMSQGKKRLWRFSEGGVIECLRQRPWLVVVMPTRQWLISDYSHHFFYIIRKEWEKDPWYTVEQAAPLFGFTKPAAVYRYIHRGWLPAEKKPCLGSRDGAWIIRRSAIEAFLTNDPRPEHKFIAASTAKKRFIVSSGEPSRLAILWVIKCPACGQEVTITASPQLRGPEIRKKFAEIYVNGNCTHGGACLIETYPIVESRKGGDSDAREGDTHTVEDDQGHQDA